MLQADLDPVLAEAVEAATELARAKRVARASKPGSLAHTTAIQSVRALEGRLNAIDSDPEYHDLVCRARDERAKTLRVAAVAWRMEEKRERLLAEANQISVHAATSNRSLL